MTFKDLFFHKKKLEVELKENQSIFDKLQYFLVVFMIVIIPLTVIAHTSNFISPDISSSYFGQKNGDDTFSFYRYVILVAATFCLALLFIIRLIFLKKQIYHNFFNWIVCSLFILLPLSVIFSPYKMIALFGLNGRYEGSLTYFCFLLVFFILMNSNFKQKQLQVVPLLTIPFLFINFILGLLHFFEYNVLDHSWFRFLIGISQGSELAKSAYIDSTLPNPNHVSGVMGMLFVLYFTLMVFESRKAMKLLYLVFSFLSFVTVLTSLSSSGFISIILVLPIVLSFVFVQKLGIRKINLLLVATLFTISATSLILLNNLNKHIFNNTVGSLPFVQKKGTEDKLANVKVSGSEIEKNVKKGSISKELDSGHSNLTLSDPNKENSSKSPSSKINVNGTLFPVIPKSNVSIGNGRIYIWKLSLDSWKERPFLGYGLDTSLFALNRNRLDYISNVGNYNLLIDKPHNFYLGILHGLGIFGLFYYLLLFGLAIVLFIKQLLRKTENLLIITMGFSVLTFGIQSAVNDPVIGSDVFFWVFFGILVNQLIKISEIPDRHFISKIKA